MTRRVVVAMSGGVDSAVTASILHQKGYDIIGVTIRSWPKAVCGTEGQKSCTSPEDARAVASHLGIPFYVVNFEPLFREKVVDYFVSEYTKGRTPNPCIPCNDEIKFGALLQRAGEMGCDAVATGHYARVVHDPGRGKFLLKEAKDARKDQSYVLFGLTQDKLRRLLFPLGEMTKEKVREEARRLGLRVAEKRESQDACFLRERDYRDFLLEEGVADRPGDIVDAEGNVLGIHTGLHRYTIGQRSGLGVALGKPVYVTAMDPAQNRLVVGPREALGRQEFWMDRVNWLGDAPREGETAHFSVKIRYRHPKTEATVRRQGDVCHVRLESPTDAVTPGQAAVFYDGETVMGGGWIR